ncbi:hypothetical protein OC861_003987 [Tilletia horrida]|nr:hypothetical protein OC861_003987 [Tilletia horrida]
MDGSKISQKFYTRTMAPFLDQTKPVSNQRANAIEELNLIITASAVACVLLYLAVIAYRQKAGRIRLTENEPSERLHRQAEDILQEDDITTAAFESVLSEPVHEEQYHQSVRNYRNILLLLALPSLLLSVLSFVKLHIEHAPALITVSLGADALLWITVVALLLTPLSTHGRWPRILQLTLLLSSTFITHALRVVIPPPLSWNSETGTPIQLPGPFDGALLWEQVAATALSFAAWIVNGLVPSGPVRLVPSAQPGTIPANPVVRDDAAGASSLSFLYYSYCFPLVKTAYTKGTLNPDDVPYVSDSYRASELHRRTQLALARLSLKDKEHSSTPPSHTSERDSRKESNRRAWRLFKVLVITNRGLVISILSLTVFAAGSFYVPWILLWMMISALERAEQANIPAGIAIRQNFVFAVAIGVVQIVSSWLVNHAWGLASANLKARFRAQLSALLLAKSLRRKDASTANDKATTGEDGKATDSDDDENTTGFATKSKIITLQTVDIERVEQFSMHIFVAINCPMELVVGGILAYKVLGISAIIGLLMSFITAPIVYYITKRAEQVQEHLMEARDKRSSSMNEAFQAIRMIKFSSWERKVIDRIMQIRRTELRHQRQQYLLDACSGFLFFLAPMLVIVTAFSSYSLFFGLPLTPSRAFTAFSVLQELRFALIQLPDTLSSAVQSWTSLRRIANYLDVPEVDVPDSFNLSSEQALGTNLQIRLQNATIGWPVSSVSSATPTASVTPTFRLRDVSASFTPKELNLICGKLGSGKTLLLQGLLGEADLLAGSMTCPRSTPDAVSQSHDPRIYTRGQWISPVLTAYVPQTAFLTNASLRSNILFGLPMIKERYDQVLDACALLPDLALFEDGDEVEIGEGGIGLSGGQKARVSLARAVYSRAQTLLLDDVLSAVDAHTAVHIHKNLLKGPLMEHRTVLLVSHQVQLVAPSASTVLVLDNGAVKYQGSSTDFLKSPHYRGLLETDEERTKPESDDIDLVNEQSKESEEDASTTTAVSQTDEKTAEPEAVVKTAPKKLVEEENRNIGAIGFATWKRYLVSAGGYKLIPVLVAVVIPSFWAVLSSWWLRAFSADAKDLDHSQHSVTYWMTGYSILVLIECILQFCKWIAVYTMSLQASRVIFKAALDAVFRAPMRFHDTVPTGRLLNRFTTDQEEVDSNLAASLVEFVDQSLAVIFAIAAVTLGGGWYFLIIVALLAPLYMFTGRVFAGAARDIRRLQQTAKSPVVQTFSDVINGVAVVRAFGNSATTLSNFFRQLDNNSRYNLFNRQTIRWLSSLYALVTATLYFSAAALIMLSGANSALAAFALTFLFSIGNNVFFVVMSYSLVETAGVAVERLVEYADLKSEAALVIEPRPPASWPHAGQVTFDNLRLRYAPDLPEVLKGVTFEVAAGQKIGIVGPTGCGKSTTVTSLFRLVDGFSGGRILIDGIDISKIGLEDLRSRLMIVPQDPVILSGTLRDSIDVFKEHTDEEVLAALKKVHLIGSPNPGVSSLSRALSQVDGEEQNMNVFEDLGYSISDGGSNLSNGQRQLLCMARALLGRSKVVIFDEASSSVDVDADDLITATLREEFADCTVITIAHRLRTIMHSDKVVVMDRGTVAEFASPAELLERPDSHFHKLCAASGKAEFVKLKELSRRDSPTHSGFLTEYPLIRVDMHTHDTPPLPPHLIGRLRSGNDANLDAAIGDLHSSQTHFRHAEIHLLTHLHSDHLVGLGDKTKWPDLVICSNATKEMLLRLETQKHRIAMDVDQEDPNPPYRHLRITKKEAQATRKVTGATLKPRDVLRGLPLNTPTQIQYTQTTKLTITLIDANHMPGAVMFLIEGPRGAVLHTGDVRAEPWWIEKLRREPVVQRWIAPDVCAKLIENPNNSSFSNPHDWATGFNTAGDGEEILSQTPPMESTWVQQSAGSALTPHTLTASNLAAGHGHGTQSQLSSQTSAIPPPENTSFVLENIYLDTECLFFTKPALSKTEAVKETIKLISQFPSNTPVFINCFTWGYEELLIGICRAFGARIHVDKYKRMMYGHLAPDHAREGSGDSGKKTSIGADSHPFLLQALTLQEDSTRFHACERQNMCSWLKRFFTPERIDRDSVPQKSDQEGESYGKTDQGNGKGGATDVAPSSWPRVITSPSSLLAQGRPGSKHSGATEEEIDKARTMHMRQIRAKDKLPDLSSPIAPLRAASAGPQRDAKDKDELAVEAKLRQNAGKTQQNILHLNPTEISAPAWKKYVASIQVDIDAAKRGEKPWPRYLFVPFARHSPLPELQSLVELFRPRTITPNTVSKRLGGWVYFIIPRLFGSALHRQNLAQLETECRSLLGLENWERAKVKEKELFGIYQSLLEERAKNKAERERQRTFTTEFNHSSNSAAKSSSTISIPPPGQGRPVAETSTVTSSKSSQRSLASAKSSNASHSDSRVSNDLVTSSAAANLRANRDQESSLMLLRLLDYYLHREPPALLETMVGDKLELERHLSDLRNIAVMGSVGGVDDEEMEIEEALAAALLSGESEEKAGHEQDGVGSASLPSKAIPSTAGYEADVSGSAPRMDVTSRAQALTGESNASQASSQKATQGGYEGGDEKDDDSEESASPSTITQLPYRVPTDGPSRLGGQPVTHTDSARQSQLGLLHPAVHPSTEDGAASLSDGQALSHHEEVQLSESVRFSTPAHSQLRPQDDRQQHDSPSLGGTSLAAGQSPGDNDRGTRFSSVIPSSPPRLSSLSIHRRRLKHGREGDSQASLTSSSQQTGYGETGELFPRSPTNDVRAARMQADVTYNETHQARPLDLAEGIPSQDQRAHANDEDWGAALLRRPTRSSSLHDPAEDMNVAAEAGSQCDAAIKQQLETVLLMFRREFTSTLDRALQLRLAYECLAKGPQLRLLGDSNTSGTTDLDNELLQYVLQDASRLQSNISEFGNAVWALIVRTGAPANVQGRQLSAEIEAVTPPLLLSIEAGYFLGHQLAKWARSGGSLRAATEPTPLALMGRIAGLIESLPDVLDTGMEILRHVADATRKAISPVDQSMLAQLVQAGHIARMTMLASAGLLHFVIQLARPVEQDDEGLEGMLKDGVLWEAKQCLGAFAKMLDEAKLLRKDESHDQDSQMSQTGPSLQRRNASGSSEWGSEESVVDGSFKRRKIDNQTTRDRAPVSIIPPSSSNEASQDADDNGLDSDFLLFPAMAGLCNRRMEQVDENKGAHRAPAPQMSGAGVNEGTSTESGGAVSDEAVERLTRRFRLEAAQIRSKVASSQSAAEPHPLARPSLWASREDDDPSIELSSQAPVVLTQRGRRRPLLIETESEATGTSTQLTNPARVNESDREAEAEGASGRLAAPGPSGQAATHAAGMTVDVSDSLWEDVSVDTSAIEAQRLRMAQEAGDGRLRSGLFSGHRHQAGIPEGQSQDL